MTDTNTDTMTDTAAVSEDPASILTEGLRRLEELRGFYDQAVADLEAGRQNGRERIAELQSEIDAENSKLNDIVIDAATEFNEESARLVETGWATPKVLGARGLATIRVPKRS